MTIEEYNNLCVKFGGERNVQRHFRKCCQDMSRKGLITLINTEKDDKQTNS